MEYKKHTHREHIYELPDTYIGSIENSKEEHFILNEEKFTQEILDFNPGFYKLVDELLVNAHDHAVRTRNSDEPVKNISISFDSQTITIKNDGKGISILQHPEYNIPIPQLIFAELLTSTNYDKKEKKLVGGKNGYGVKLVNIFSKKFELTIVDSEEEQKYQQTFEDNMTKIGKPRITSCKAKSSIEIVWTPDFQKFGWTEIPQSILKVIERRVHDLAMTVGSTKVTLNSSTIKYKDLQSYALKYIDNVITFNEPQWNIAVGESDKFLSVSFVNGVWTRGGKHVDEILNQIVSFFVDHLEQKKKIKVKPSFIKESLAIFISCSIENPSFSSQTKEIMTSKVSCKLSPEFLKKLLKLGIIDKVLEEQEKKDKKDDKKTDGKKQSRIVVPKLNDAGFAGTVKSQECILILTEGDSAKAMALSGLSQEQRAYFGVYPLRGKLLNVKDVSTKKISETEEITNLKKIMGLESAKKYADLKSLRYGKILIMTDQDYDGSHIRGLLINVFHELWHTLFKVPGFLNFMSTPIVKAFKGSKTLSFYTQYEYEQWKVQNQGYKIKYYKGLGTSTALEAKEYFKSPNIIGFQYNEKSDESLELAFNKSKADDRKVWLQSHKESDILNPVKQVLYEDFINKDLIHFSNYNLERSIPNIMDGLKTSQRKILFSSFKRNLKSEIRVAQFAGYVSEHSGYHHGEASLNDTIIGMAQDFVGSQNIPWFVPQGQFGTRLQGGKDAASPRYIHTFMQPYLTSLIHPDDSGCLVYRDDDGLKVEPHWYAPIIPMLLINGARGIGTGYSTFIPQCNPQKLIEGLKKWLKSEITLEQITIEPWYRGFQGTIENLEIKGCLKKEKDTLIITELPIETWTSDYKEWLDQKIQEGVIKDYEDTSTDTQVLFKIKCSPESIPIIEKSLAYKLKLTNMHAFNFENTIQKYESLFEILEEFCIVRKDLYKKRKTFMLAELKERLPYHENVVRFITQQCFDMPIPDLKRKTPEECDKLLEQQKFIKISDSYDYLLNLPIKSLTSVHARKHHDELDSLKAKISQLEKKTPELLWLDDLETFHSKYSNGKV
jgi:DNA topoisomerase II